MGNRHYLTCSVYPANKLKAEMTKAILNMHTKHVDISSHPTYNGFDEYQLVIATFRDKKNCEIARTEIENRKDEIDGRYSVQ
jgi:hypothetical protein